MITSRIFVIITLISFIFSGVVFAEKKSKVKSGWPVLKGPYLGQKPPGMIPEIFAPQIFSRSKPEWVFDTVFSPSGNELYFTLFDQEKKIDQIMFMKKVNNIWTKPKAVSFNSGYSSHNLCISQDGCKIFFKSWKPLPGRGIGEKHSFIWFTNKIKTGWSKPEPIKYGNVYLPAGHPSVCSNGNLYFRYRSKNNTGNADIHFSKFTDGRYSTPVNLGKSINTEYTEGDVSVAPDESYLVVACWDRPDNNGDCDLYVSFNNRDGSWTPLKNIGEPINKEHIENNPMISPGGKYIFYMSMDVSSKVAKCSSYWVSAKIIEDLKPKNLK